MGSKYDDHKVNLEKYAGECWDYQVSEYARIKWRNSNAATRKALAANIEESKEKYRNSRLPQREAEVKKLIEIAKKKPGMGDLPTAKDDAIQMLNYAFSHLNMTPDQITIMSSPEDFEIISNRVLWDTESKLFKMQRDCPAGDPTDKLPALDENLLPLQKLRYSLLGRYLTDADF